MEEAEKHRGGGLRSRAGVVVREGGEVMLGGVDWDAQIVVGLSGKRGMGTCERKTLAKGFEDNASMGCSARGSSRWSILSSRTSLESSEWVRGEKSRVTYS